MRLKLAALIIPACVFISACSGSAKTYYYTLQTESSAAKNVVPAVLTSIAISAVSLPELVDRPQLVLRSGETQLSISDNHLWGQSLKSEITHNLAVNLAHETNVAHVSLPGQSGVDAAEIKIAVDILRFDSAPGKTATVEARWSVQRKGNVQSVSHHAVEQESVTGANYDALIAAHSRALARLSRDIATTLK